MASKWFNKFFDAKTRKKYFHKHPGLIDFDRECVARGVAVGFFIGMIPILPFQTVLVILLCILLRGNLPIAFLISWISNPITIIPLTYFTYYIGDWILGASSVEAVRSVQEFSLRFDSMQGFLTSFSAWILQFGKGFFVGLPIIAFGSAIIGYLVVQLFWNQGVKVYHWWQKKQC